MTFLPVQLRTRSTSDPHGTLIRGILPDQKGGSSPSDKRDMDDSHDVTLFALENVIAIIVSREHSFRFGVYKQWEADFLRHLLGHTTFEEEHSYNEACNRTLVCVVTILPLNAALERS